VINVPVNAYFEPSSYGAGWKCHRGFRAVKSTCVAVIVPENAYLKDKYDGRGWKCNRRYRAVSANCVAVTLPQNAHIAYSGDEWQCDPPYRKNREFCTLP